MPHRPKPPTASVAPERDVRDRLGGAAHHLVHVTAPSVVQARRPARRPARSIACDPSHARRRLTAARGGPRLRRDRALRAAATGPGCDLHVVTGKGGTGKSTVAAALALALAARGKNVLLCEVEGRQGIAQMFDVDPLPYEERRIARGLAGPTGRAGDVYALHIDAESALLEYLAMYYRLGRAGRALDRFGVIDFATTIAPGVRDVLLTGKVYEAVQQQPPQGPRAAPAEYDAVVLDAPPTGRITQFLNVNSELAGLAKVGPIKNQADTVMTLFRSPRTAVHLVTVLEEMPVQETADGIAELREARAARSAAWSSTWSGRATSAARTWRPPGPASWTATRIGTDLGTAGLDVDDELRRRAARRGPRPRRAPRARGRPAQAGRRARRPDVRAAPAARRRRPRRPLRAGRRCSRPRAWHDAR